MDQARKAPLLADGIQATPTARGKSFSYWGWTRDEPATPKSIAAHLRQISDALRATGVPDYAVHNLDSLRQSLEYWYLETDATYEERAFDASLPAPAGEQMLAVGKELFFNKPKK